MDTALPLWDADDGRALPPAPRMPMAMLWREALRASLLRTVRVGGHGWGPWASPRRWWYQRC